MQKKLIGILVAGAMLVAQAMPVLAAGSAIATPSKPDETKVEEALENLGASVDKETAEIIKDNLNSLDINEIKVSVDESGKVSAEQVEQIVNQTFEVQKVQDAIKKQNPNVTDKQLQAVKDAVKGIAQAVADFAASTSNGSGNQKDAMKNIAAAIEEMFAAKAQAGVAVTAEEKAVANMLKSDKTDALTGFIDIKVDENVKKVMVDGEEKIPVAFEVPSSVVSYGKDVSVQYFLVHYSTTGKWELVKATVDPKTGLVIGYFSDLSPVMLIAEVTQLAPETPDVVEPGTTDDKKPGASEGGQGSGSDPVGGPSGQAIGKSPQTNVQNGWDTFFGKLTALLK